MNSPEEKAKQMTDRVMQLMYGRQVELFQSKVKEVTTFCVDEILSCYSRYTGMYDQDFFDADAAFWQNVKTEIQKL